jgi:hypothetical protein
MAQAGLCVLPGKVSVEVPTIEQNAMKPVADQVLAERVLVTLKSVQFSPVAHALTELSILSGDVASRTADGDQRRGVFTEIQKLRGELARFPNSPDLGALWDNAIDKTGAWREWLLR